MTTANLLAPLEFDPNDIAKFIRDHVCWCGSRLMPKTIPGSRNFNAICLEHGLIIESGAVKKFIMNKVDKQILETEYYINEKKITAEQKEFLKNATDKQIDEQINKSLSELGF